MKKDIMRGLWLAYIAGDEKAFDRVSLRAFREPEQETETDVKGNVYAIKAVNFCGEEKKKKKRCLNVQINLFR